MRGGDAGGDSGRSGSLAHAFDQFQLLSALFEVFSHLLKCTVGVWTTGTRKIVLKFIDLRAERVRVWDGAVGLVGCFLCAHGVLGLMECKGCWDGFGFIQKHNGGLRFTGQGQKKGDDPPMLHRLGD